MTISQIINLSKPLSDLSGFSDLSAKVRWNLARNLRSVAEVAKDFEAQRTAIVKRIAFGKETIEAGTPEHEVAVKEIQELLEVEAADVKLLKFQASDILRDDVPVPATLLAALDELIEGEP